MVGASRLAWESAVPQALLCSPLTSSHRETHNRPVKTVWRENRVVFGNQQQIPMAAQKKKRQNKTQHPHKDIFKINFKKIEPSIDHQSSWCLTKKYLELSQLYLKCPGYETIIVLLFRYLLTTVGTTDVEWQASENCNEVGTNSF